jgi:hypothetical protein
MRIADEGAIAGDAARDIERSSIPPYRFLLCTSGLEMIALRRLAALISAGPNLPMAASARPAAPGVLFRRQVRWTQWARWLAPVLRSGWGHRRSPACKQNWSTIFIGERALICENHLHVILVLISSHCLICEGISGDNAISGRSVRSCHELSLRLDDSELNENYAAANKPLGKGLGYERPRSTGYFDRRQCCCRRECHLDSCMDT